MKWLARAVSRHIQSVWVDRELNNENINDIGNNGGVADDNMQTKKQESQTMVPKIARFDQLTHENKYTLIQESQEVIESVINQGFLVKVSPTLREFMF